MKIKGTHKKILTIVSLFSLISAYIIMNNGMCPYYMVIDPKKYSANKMNFPGPCLMEMRLFLCLHFGQFAMHYDENSQPFLLNLSALVGTMMFSVSVDRQ